MAHHPFVPKCKLTTIGPQFLFVVVAVESCLAPCDPMDCSTPGFPVLHLLLEPAQTHVHWVNDAIQPSHPLLPSSPAFNLSQHQGLFQWVGFVHQEAKYGASASASVLPMNIQDWFPLGVTGLIPLLSKGLSRVFSSTTVWKHHFFGAQPSLWSTSQILPWLLDYLHFLRSSRCNCIGTFFLT